MNKLQDLRGDVVCPLFRGLLVVVVAEVPMGKLAEMHDEFVSVITDGEVTHCGMFCWNGGNVIAIGMDNKQVVRERESELREKCVSQWEFGGGLHDGVDWQVLIP